MTIPFAIQHIDHVVLRTANPERLEAFYTAVIGCPVVKRQDKIGLVQLRAGHALIDILAVQPGDAATAPHGSATGNMDHLCLRIEPFDIDALRRHFAAHGITIGDRVAPLRSRRQRTVCLFRGSGRQSHRAKGPARAGSVSAAPAHLVWCPCHLRRGPSTGLSDHGMDAPLHPRLS